MEDEPPPGGKRTEMPLDPDVYSSPPNVKKRLLRQILRAQRESAGLKQKEAADRVVWSLSKLIRIETGAVPITPADVRLLLLEYGVDEDLRNDLVELAKQARKPDNWADYRDYISPAMQTLLDNEAAASVILQFEPAVVPGLLQTPDYTSALLKEQGISSKKAEKIQEIRYKRQEVLQSKDRPDLNFLLGEAALSYAIGGAQVMRMQIKRLRELADSHTDNLLLQTLPFSLGGYPGMDRSFTLYQFRVAVLPDLLYMENSRDDFAERDDRETVDLYYGHFWDLWERANRGAGGNALLAQLHNDLDRIEKLHFR